MPSLTDPAFTRQYWDGTTCESGWQPRLLSDLKTLLERARLDPAATLPDS